MKNFEMYRKAVLERVLSEKDFYRYSKSLCSVCRDVTGLEVCVDRAIAWLFEDVDINKVPTYNIGDYLVYDNIICKVESMRVLQTGEQLIALTQTHADVVPSINNLDPKINHELSKKLNAKDNES